jgi:hypothetical protein
MADGKFLVGFLLLREKHGPGLWAQFGLLNEELKAHYDEGPGTRA